MRRLVIWVVVAAAVVALGVGAFALFHHDKPFKVDNYFAMCTGSPRGFPQAAARSATAPHPIYVDYWNVNEDDADPLDAQLDIWNPTDPAQVQLVACVVGNGKGNLVRHCDYSRSGSTFTQYLYQGKYRVMLYEARTGRLVANLDIVGDKFDSSHAGSAEPQCPFEIGVNAADPHSFDDIVAGPYVQQIQDALTPYVLR